MCYTLHVIRYTQTHSQIESNETTQLHWMAKNFCKQRFSNETTPPSKEVILNNIHHQIGCFMNCNVVFIFFFSSSRQINGRNTINTIFVRVANFSVWLEKDRSKKWEEKPIKRIQNRHSHTHACKIVFIEFHQSNKNHNSKFSHNATLSKLEQIFTISNNFRCAREYDWPLWFSISFRCFFLNSLCVFHPRTYICDHTPFHFGEQQQKNWRWPNANMAVLSTT